MINYSKKRSTVKLLLFITVINLIITGFFINTSALHGSYYLRTQSVSGLGEVDSLDLTVLTDNYPNGELTDEWGLSILVETSDSSVLIDTGQSYDALRDNSLALNKDLSDVDFVVISHEHWDHIGGLGYIEEVNPNVTVYVPEDIDNQVFNTINQSNLNIVKISDTTVIRRGFAIVGQLYGPPYEHALAVNVKGVGLVCFTGCSHPGVEFIVEKAITDLAYDCYMVIGGFHMVGATEQQIDNTIGRLLELGVKKIYPIHCSGDGIREYMADNYPSEYGQGNVGFQLTVNVFAVNWIVFFILIPAIGIFLAVLTGWFIRKKVRGKKGTR